MNVYKKEFKRFISQSDIVFVIPVYQRNYDWKIGNCKQLFSDILESCENKTQHFIGTVCHKMDGRYKSVIIDGQQRITSLMLLLKVIYDISEDKRLKERIKEQYLINKYSPDNDLRIKLKPIKKDEKIYQKLITIEPFNENLFDSKEQSSNIFRNYMCFREMLLEVENLDLEEFLLAIEDLQIVELMLDNENPQVIFESLNSTGMDLTNADLLRNYLLMSLDYSEQEELYKKYWLGMEEMINSERMEEFFLYYLIFKRRTDCITIENRRTKLCQANLYYTFKKYFPNVNKNSKEKVEDCLKEMYRFCTYYSKCIFNETEDYNKLGKQGKKYYELFYLLEISSAAILFMYLCDLGYNGKLVEQDFLKILDILIIFSVRSKVCKRMGITNQFASLTIQKIESMEIRNSKDYVDAFWSIFSSAKGSQGIAKDKEFFETLAYKELNVGNKSDRAMYLLGFIEKYITGRYNSEMSLEYICPKKLSDDWKDYLNKHFDMQNYEMNCHKIGNLTLVEDDLVNSNDTFELKRLKYKDSCISLTRELSNKSNWLSTDIQKRSEFLAKKALEVWPIPEKYNRIVTIDTGITYNLDSDFSLFTGTKPNSVTIMGTDYSITNWNDFLEIVYKEIHNLDSTLIEKYYQYLVKIDYDKTVQKHNSDYNRYFTIDNIYFINIVKNTKNILESIRNYIDFIDRTEGLDLKSEISFTLSK